MPALRMLLVNVFWKQGFDWLKSLGYCMTPSKAWRCTLLSGYEGKRQSVTPVFLLVNVLLLLLLSIFLSVSVFYLEQGFDCPHESFESCMMSSRGVEDKRNVIFCQRWL